MFEFDVKGFLRQRLSRHIKELNRYFRYIFNGHITFAMLFLVSALAYYYKAWLADLPAEFPSALVIGIIFGVVVSWSPIRTLLQEADLVFLLVAEKKLKSYFRGTFLYSFLSQFYLLLLAVAVLGPLFFASRPEQSGKDYLLILVVLVIFKVWNLLANWWMLQVHDVRKRRLEQGIRWILNILLFWMVAKGEMLFAGIGTLLFVAIFLWDYTVYRRQAGLNWERLVEKDLHSMQSFYRFANLFTDVPHLRNRVKRRDWLVGLLPKLSFKQISSFDYLYRRTFIRSGDYFGMYVRLIVIGGLLIWFLPNFYMKLVFALLFLYMSIFQMVPLYKHHRTVLWLDLYPIPEKLRKQAALKLLFRLGVIQTFVFALLFAVLGLWTGAVIALAGGLVFSYWFLYYYINKKL